MTSRASKLTDDNGDDDVDVDVDVDTTKPTPSFIHRITFFNRIFLM